MYAKLFSRIAQSSLMEQDVETRYCFMMLLAIADSSGDVIGTDVALARAINLPIEVFKRCVVALMSPDPDSNSQVHEGRRLVPSDSGRGYFIVNYVTYRSIKTAEEKKAYMREYMKRYRKSKNPNDVTGVNVGKEIVAVLAHAEGEGDSEGDSEERREEAARATDAESPNEKSFISMCLRHNVPDWYARNRFVWWDTKEWKSGQTKMNWKKVPRLVAQDYENAGRPSTPPINGVQERPIRGRVS